MRDYDELIERLRYCADRPICFSTQCDYRQTAHIGACFDSLKHDAADAIEELIAAVPTWISVEERLPEDFQKVLVFWWEHGEPMIDTAFWQKDAKRFDGEHWVRMEDKVTHWMPLPAPPKEVE